MPDMHQTVAQNRLPTIKPQEINPGSTQGTPSHFLINPAGAAGETLETWECLTRPPGVHAYTFSYLTSSPYSGGGSRQPVERCGGRFERAKIYIKTRELLPGQPFSPLSDSGALRSFLYYYSSFLQSLSWPGPDWFLSFSLSRCWIPITARHSAP